MATMKLMGLLGFALFAGLAEGQQLDPLRQRTRQVVDVLLGKGTVLRERSNHPHGGPFTYDALVGKHSYMVTSSGSLRVADWSNTGPPRKAPFPFASEKVAKDHVAALIKPLIVGRRLPVPTFKTSKDVVIDRTKTRYARSNISYTLTRNGYPFFDQQYGVYVSLDIKTGRVVQYLEHFDLPVTEPARIAVTQREAREYAAEYARTKPAKLKFVGIGWRKGGSGPLKLAYGFRLEEPSKRFEGLTDQLTVYIDALTGYDLGGLRLAIGERGKALSNPKTPKR